MKKILLGMVGLVALSLSAPASAADLAARPYTKAPPMIAAIYDWSGFYIGINGGGGSSHKCWDLTNAGFGPIAPSAKAAMTPPAAPSVVRSAIAGRSAAWVFGLEAQGNWADFKGSNVSSFTGHDSNQHQDRRVRPVHRPDRLRLEQRPVLREGRRGGDRRQDTMVIAAAGALIVDQPRKPAGAARSAPASNLASHRTGRSAVEYDHLFMGNHNASPRIAAGASRVRQHPPGRRYGHRPRQLPLGWPGDREVLISQHLPEFEKAGLAPAFLLAFYACLSCRPDAAAYRPRACQR